MENGVISSFHISLGCYASLNGYLSNCCLQMVKEVVFKVGFSPSKKNYFICFNESPLKMMKNTFYFILKALFVPLTFSSCRKLDDQKCKVTFKIYNVTNWLKNNYSTHIAQYHTN